VEYIKVQWIHSRHDYPVWLYSELDDARWEVRKVEIFSDCSVGFATRDSSQGDTRLGQLPIPRMEEIAKDKQFKPEKISAEQFELVWRNRFNTNLPQ
jgi:hypothetical protein